MAGNERQRKKDSKLGGQPIFDEKRYIP